MVQPRMVEEGQQQGWVAHGEMGVEPQRRLAERTTDGEDFGRCPPCGGQTCLIAEPTAPEHEGVDRRGTGGVTDDEVGDDTTNQSV